LYLREYCFDSLRFYGWASTNRSKAGKTCFLAFDPTLTEDLVEQYVREGKLQRRDPFVFDGDKIVASWYTDMVEVGLQKYRMYRAIGHPADFRWYCEAALSAVRFDNADFLRHFTRWHLKLPTGSCITVPATEPCPKCKRRYTFLHKDGDRLRCRYCCESHILRYSDAVAGVVNPIARTIASHKKHPPRKTWRLDPKWQTLRSSARASQDSTSWMPSSGSLPPLSREFGSESLSAAENAGTKSLHQIPTVNGILDFLRAQNAPSDVITYAEAKYADDDDEEKLPTILGWNIKRTKSAKNQFFAFKKEIRLKPLPLAFAEFREVPEEYLRHPLTTGECAKRYRNVTKDVRQCPWYRDAAGTLCNTMDVPGFKHRQARPHRFGPRLVDWDQISEGDALSTLHVHPVRIQIITPSSKPIVETGGLWVPGDPTHNAIDGTWANSRSRCVIPSAAKQRKRGRPRERGTNYGRLEESQFDICQSRYARYENDCPKVEDDLSLYYAILSESAARGPQLFPSDKAEDECTCVRRLMKPAVPCCVCGRVNDHQVPTSEEGTLIKPEYASMMHELTDESGTRYYCFKCCPVAATDKPAHGHKHKPSEWRPAYRTSTGIAVEPLPKSHPPEKHICSAEQKAERKKAVEWLFRRKVSDRKSGLCFSTDSTFIPAGTDLKDDSQIGHVVGQSVLGDGRYRHHVWYGPIPTPKRPEPAIPDNPRIRTGNISERIEAELDTHDGQTERPGPPVISQIARKIPKWTAGAYHAELMLGLPRNVPKSDKPLAIRGEATLRIESAENAWPQVERDLSRWEDDGGTLVDPTDDHRYAVEFNWELKWKRDEPTGVATISTPRPYHPIGPWELKWKTEAEPTRYRYPIGPFTRWYGPKWFRKTPVPLKKRPLERCA
jgi:hypothetical protein